ncbi:hypothetical protein [Pleurochrysis carterae circular virus]|nr:hypothetical protein [Pleurochrysis carterae circular virus]AUD57240.1 hypothetical protein [Pleurochrysis carterae circular virus]
MLSSRMARAVCERLKKSASLSTSDYLWQTQVRPPVLK